MKVSLNWIKEFTAVDAPIDELVQKIGAQLGAVEETIDLSKRYQGIVVVRVVSCAEHDNSDHLHVCKIDDGGKVQDVERDENGHVQVVCGAPNVREGLTVAWLPPGVTVPESFDKEPFVLEAREIRGQKSNGMLASARELALGDNHEGILEITDDVAPGTDFAQFAHLNDHIIDIENKMFTHRPDCFGELGVAREVAGIQQRQFTSPEWYMNPQAPQSDQSEAVKGLSVDVQIPELCSRYMAIALNNVQVKPSPLWLQSYLNRVGIRAINNIVDMTNYMMMLTGQPLHAFDFDKVARDGQAHIVVRKPHEGETMTLLDGKEITPRAEAVLICDEDKPIALGGVMGGNNSEIDTNTKRIIIESANFDMYNVRRTSMEHGIFTDAVTRFNKGQSPEQCAAVLYKAVELTRQLSEGASVASEVVDINNASKHNQPVQVSASFVNERLGEELSAEDMANLLDNVEFKVEVNEDQLTVTAPFWRTDIEIPEDVVEEVGRLYGYDKLPLELPQRSIQPAKKDELLELKAKIRASLAKFGANEVLTYSFVHGNLLDKVGQDSSQAFQLSNALSPDLQYYRLSLTPSLLERVHPNIKAGYDQFALFEMGKGHNLLHTDADDGLPMEFEMLDFVYAATDKTHQTGAAFYTARTYVTLLADMLGIQLEFRPFEAEEDYPVVKPYDHTRSAKIFVKGTDQPLGMVGEYKPSVVRTLKLPKYVAGFGLGLTQLLAASKPKAYRPLSRFPSVQQDVSLRVPTSLSHHELHSFLLQKLAELKPGHTYASLETLDIFQKQGDAEYKNVTTRLTIASYEKTMTDVGVNALLEKIAAAAHQALDAERI